MTTYYQYDPTFLDWVGISTVSVSYATSEYVPVSVAAGSTQTWTGSGWSTTTDYRGTYYYTTDDYNSIGASITWRDPNVQPTLAFATATAPPAISTTGYNLGWDGSDWTVTAATTLPEGDEVVSLGSPTNKYKDLYVSEGTVYLGVHSLSVSTNNLQYDGEDVVTGVGGTIGTDYADITSVNAGVITATQVGAANSGTLLLDGNYVPTHNKTFDLGTPLKSWKKVYINNGPKAIEFGNTNIGLGFTVNGQGENLLEFDGHELFFGDGDIGQHGNLNNIYAAGIVSATVGAQVGVLTANTITSSGVQDLFVRTDLVPSADDTYELGSASNRWKDIYLDGGQSVLNIGDVAIGVTDGHLVVDGREAPDLTLQGDLGQAGRLRNIYATGVVTATAFIGSGSSLTGLVTNIDDLGDVSTAGITTGDMLVYDGSSWVADAPPVGGGGGATCTLYEFSTSTSMTDPGSRRLRVNNSTQKDATELSISNKNDNTYDIGNLISVLPIGSKIYIQRKDRPDEYHVFRTTATPVQENNYLTITISSFNSGDINIASGKDVIVCFQAPNQVKDEDITPASVALGSGGPSWTNGTGSPEGVVTAPVGSLYSRTDGGTGTTLYVKESGTGNTGWVAK